MTKTITGYVDVPVEDREDFARALPEHSHLTQQETGCLYFRVTADPDIEGRYTVEEAFVDENAYQAHADRTRLTEWFHVTRNIKRSYAVS